MEEWKEENKTLPVPFVQFVNGFHVHADTTNEVEAYKIYLKENSYRHTYGKYSDWNEWLTAELTAYLTK